MRSFARLVVSALVFCAMTGWLASAAAARSVRITGLVVDYRAQPVEGAAVLLYDESAEKSPATSALTKHAETISSADGRFAISFEQKEESFVEHWLVTHKNGLAMSWTAQTLEARSVIVRLGRAVPFGGVVVDEAGRPVAGARVNLCVKNEMMDLRELLLPGSEGWQTRQTDGGGRFLFDNLPADTTADFQIEAPGRARFWTFHDFGPGAGEQFPVGRTDLRLTLPPAARIEGTVIDEDTGKPAPGLCVLPRFARPASAKYQGVPVPVDPNGRFVLAGLAAGTYRLEVTAPPAQTQEWFSRAPLLTVESGQTVRDFRLPVNRGAMLEIVTREPDSDALAAGVHAYVEGDSFFRTLTTDAKGSARLRLPSGKYSVWGRKEGHWMYLPRNIYLEKGQIDQEEVRDVGKAVHVSGTALDPEGHALAGVSVVFWPYWPNPPTDTEGRFEQTGYTTGSGSKQTVWLRHEPSGRAAIVELKDPSGNRHPSGRIVLMPAYSLSGRVSDPNGVGIPAATVRLVANMANRSPRRIRTLVELVTDANGTYQLRGIPKPDPNPDGPRFEQYYALVARAPGYSETSIDPVSLEGPVEEPIRLRTLVLLPANRTLSGVVVDVNDKPVPGALVATAGLNPHGYDEHEDATQPHRQVLADSQGRFQIDGICPGPVEVDARTPGSDSRESVTYTAAGEKNVKIVLDRTLSFGKSLIGTALPSLADLGLREPLPGLEDKAVLLCFLDIQQRPSRQVLRQLAQDRKELTQRNIVPVIVQAAPCDAREWDKLAAEYVQDLPYGKATADSEKTQRAWGIQSLPWLILADRGHTIRAEGFPPAVLPERLLSLR